MNILCTKLVLMQIACPRVILNKITDDKIALLEFLFLFTFLDRNVPEPVSDIPSAFKASYAIVRCVFGTGFPSIGVNHVCCG